MTTLVTTRLSGGNGRAVQQLEQFSQYALLLRQQSVAWNHVVTTWQRALMNQFSIHARTSSCPANKQYSFTSQAGHRRLASMHVYHYPTMSSQAQQISKKLADTAYRLEQVCTMYSHNEHWVRSLFNAGVSMAQIPLTVALLPHMLIDAVRLAPVAKETQEDITRLARGVMTHKTGMYHEGMVHGMAIGVMALLRIPTKNPIHDLSGLIGTWYGYETAKKQGDYVVVSQKTPRVDVVRPVTNTQEALEELRRLSEERLGKVTFDGGPSGLEYGTIAIQQYTNQQGEHSWLVIIPGTDGQHDSPFTWASNFELMSSDKQQRMHADSARMVIQAMQQAGIKPDDNVALIGHSQGGIVAAELASDYADRFNFKHIITAGSPVAGFAISSQTWVTSIEMEDELVAALDGKANSTHEQWLTVRGSTTEIDNNTSEGMQRIENQVANFEATVVQNMPGPRDISHWIEFHQAAYQQAAQLSSPVLEVHDAHFSSVLQGTPTKITYWQGRMTQEYGGEGKL